MKALSDSARLADLESDWLWNALNDSARLPDLLKEATRLPDLDMLSDCERLCDWLLNAESDSFKLAERDCEPLLY